jgi:NitT/TauT family transport system substrate-binding protein
MARPRTYRLAIVLIGLLAFSLLAGPAAAEKKQFKHAWSIYVGWMPWAYAAEKGIVDKWADKYGIEIEVVQFNDYIESINQYTAGQFDSAVMTNMDALTIPAAGGVDTTALIIGDFSNGNDAVILKGEDRGLADIKGDRVNLVELSVSHYALARALDSVGLSERDVTVVNTSDADMVGIYPTSDVTAMVTWNPQVSEIVGGNAYASVVFDSSQIPGEIIDITMINTETMQKHPEYAKALVGAWYETMSIMAKDDAEGRAARTFMGEASGTDLAGYEAQLAATRMFYNPAEAVAFVQGKDLIKTMDLVRNFSYKHGILGEGADSPDAVGIEFPGGTILGDTGNVKLRYTDEFMQMAADGKL